jgi:menaquinone-dependent protoporphyrinogen oxidase
MACEILVAFASAQESTRAIAAAVAEDLREVGFTVVLEPAEKVGGVHRFDAVVLGTAIHDVTWLPGIGEFMAAHRRDLEMMPVWIFASGPAEKVVRNELEDPPADLIKMVERIGPRDIALFAGEMQPHHVAACLRALSRITRTTIGDHTDYHAIRRWADSIRREVIADQRRPTISVMTIPPR